MNILKRLLYMILGAFLALGITIGGIAVFAQEDEPEAVTPAPDLDVESEAFPLPGLRFHRESLADLRGQDEELLAGALGITVEELEAAEDEAYAAAIEQAVAEGFLTEEQAQQLLDSSAPFRHPLLGSADKEALLAEALGISVEELQAAKAEARAARLAEMVEAGILTQEEADLMAAREAVQSYVDQEALAGTLQNAYQAAIDAALSAGAISEAQAEQLQENMPSFNSFNFFGHGFGGRGGRGHHGFRGALPDVDASIDIFQLDQANDL